MSRLRPLYFASLRGSGLLYPDANSTLRVTFGTIEGYSPRDATYYGPRTTLRGVLAKETGKEPFASPRALLAAAADEKKTAPYRDPALESIDADFLFNPAVTRSIHVDARYMLWVMDAVDGADALLRELGADSKVE